MDSIDALLEVYPDGAVRDDPPRHRPGDPVGGEPPRRHLRVPAERTARSGLRRQPGGVLGAIPAQDARLPRRRQRRPLPRHRLRRDAPRPDPRHRAPLRVARRRAHRRRRHSDADLVGDEPGRQAGHPRLQPRAVRHRHRRPARASSPSTTTGSRRPDREDARRDERDERQSIERCERDQPRPTRSAPSWSPGARPGSAGPPLRTSPEPVTPSLPPPADPTPSPTSPRLVAARSPSTSPTSTRCTTRWPPSKPSTDGSARS